MNMRGFVSRPLVLGVLLVAVLAAGFGAYWFQPWKLFTDTTVRDAVPVAAPKDEPRSTDPTDPTAPATVSGGTLISHEHATSGSVKVLRLADGSRILRIEDLDTSDGPDLRVVLSDAKVVPGKAGWHVFDDGQHTTLAKLKGNKGDQNYPLPANLDLNRFRSVSIWCDRFDVSFGAAELKAM